MTTQIQLQSTPVEKDIEVHVMPCHIAYNGPSKISEFFKARPQDPETQTSISSFRGRKLCCRTVSLPENYTGHVYTPLNSAIRMDTAKYGDEDEEDEDEGEKVEWESREKFKSITVWEHHSLPDAKQEHWIRGIEEWIGMAEVMASAGYKTNVE